MRINIIILLFISLAVANCKSQGNKNVSIEYESGKFHNNIYSNDLLGFELKIDTPWILLNKKELLELMQERVDQIEAVSENKVNSNFNKGVKILLSLTIDSTETMPHILVSRLDLDSFPNLQNERDFLTDYNDRTRSLYQHYDVHLSFSEIETEVINSRTFKTMTLTVISGGYTAYQKEYSIKLGNTLLNIMTNYNSDSTLNKCREFLNSIKWK